VLTADFQQNAPHFWWLFIVWGRSIAKVMEAGSCDTFEELRAIQQRLSVIDKFTCIDMGWNGDVVKEHCSRYGVKKMTAECIKYKRPPLHLGWTPFVGEKEGNFLDKQRRAQFPVRLNKEIITAYGSAITMPFYELNDKGLKDMVAAIRKGEKKSLRLEFAPSVHGNPEFWRHLDAEIKIIERVGTRTKEKWDLRSDRWPNHWLDCLKASLGISLYHQLYVDPVLSKQMFTKV
jgi:hypothetical protein